MRPSYGLHKSGSFFLHMNSSFLKNLRFWTGHCLLNALPSFLIAGLYLDYFQSLSDTLAMLMGITVFIFAYATVFTFVPRFHDQKNSFGRAVRLALKIRIVLFAFGILGAVIPTLFLFHPDYYAGLAAFEVQKIFYAAFFDLAITPEKMTLFFDIFIWTLLEGAILTAFLMALSSFVFCLIHRANPESSSSVSPSDY